MTFEEWVGKIKMVEAGTTVLISESSLGRKAQAMGWIGEGDPFGENDEYRIHVGLFTRIPEVRTIKGKFWPTEPLGVAVHNGQVVAFDYCPLIWCRYDHRGKGLASACQMKRCIEYPDYMAYLRTRLAYQEKHPEKYTVGGLATVRRRYKRLVERGVIQGEA